MQKSNKNYMEIGKYIGKSIKMNGIIYKMVGNGWEMVGEYPTYVLRSGGIPSGGFFSSKVGPFL